MNFLADIDRKILLVIVAAVAIVVCLDRFLFGEIGQSVPLEANKNTLLAPSSVQSVDTSFQSKTAWGMNPFGSGEPIKEEVILKFKQPNTEWKARTISGVTYVFGEGNPKEVAPKLSDYNNPWNDYHEAKVVRPKAEKLLANFLSNPLLTTVMNKCGYITKPTDTSIGIERGLPEVIFSTNFDMESLIVINPSTGQKNLNLEKFYLLESVLYQIHDNVKECLNNSEVSNFDKLLYEYYSAKNSFDNSSDENKKEVCDFLEMDECN